MHQPGTLLVLALLAAPLPAAETSLSIGQPLPRGGTTLRDLRGTRRALHDLKDYKAYVVVFLGSECPVSNLYLPEIVAQEKTYRAKKVQFVAVYPNERENLDQIAGHAYDRDVSFPIWKDTHQKLADQLGVTRVPSVVVLDGDFKVRYRGRVNDQYGAGSRRPKASREDLTVALDELLDGKPVSVPETEADGCLLGRPAKRDAKANVTYTKDVAPVLQKHCQACHRPGQAAPFSLMDYDDAIKHAKMIREVTAERRMPPWHADPRHGKFINSRRMKQEEIDTLADWVEAGTPRGDMKDMPKPAEFPTGWALGKPDMVLQMPESFDVPATGTLPYKNFIVDPNFTEDRWVTMAEARPGVPGVVHHIVVYMQRGNSKSPLSADGSLSVLVGWAPGDLGLVCPPDTALRIPKGVKLRIEMHYTPNGTAATDRSSIGLTFAKKPPRFELYTNEFANVGISVPPFDPHYRAEATFRVPADARVLSFVPHMHWRGKSFRYDVTLPGGKRETVLSVPRWDFNWQNVYRFEEPMRLPKGSKIHAIAHFDNSRNNPMNPAPEKKVNFGLQTWDEMMVGWVTYVWERPETSVELAKNPPSQADQLFDRLDANGDDVITANELPGQMKMAVELMGLKPPEKMTRKEFAEWFAALRGGARKKP